MASFGGKLTINSIPDNMTMSIGDGSISSISEYTGTFPYVYSGPNESIYMRFYRNGTNVTKSVDVAIDDIGYLGAKVFHISIVDSEIDYLILYPDSRKYMCITSSVHFFEKPGSIPMGELTFNGVQSVTYNGTDYTKLVVDGTSYPPPVTIISFTIAGTSYQAEEDMTWGEWVESSYNTGGFEIISGRVINSSGYVAYKDQSVNIAVSKNTIIIANRSYVYGSGTPDKEP